MERWWIMAVALVLLQPAAGRAQGGLDVRIQTRDQRVLAGRIVGREPGQVVFQQGGEPEVRIPDAGIGMIQFQISAEEDSRIARLYDAREFHAAAEMLERMLTPFLPYVGIPSNVSQNFLRWMVASYWTGNPARVLELAAVFQRFPGEYQRAARYFSILAQLDSGNLGEVEAFLNTAGADEVFQPGSAARMYIDAVLLQFGGNPHAALQVAARMIAKHSRDTDWIPRVELLCAELYFELGMPESAAGVLGDIREFYNDPYIQERAAALAAKHK